MRLVFCIGLVVMLNYPSFLLSESETGIKILPLLPRISENDDWKWGDEPTMHEPESLFEYLNGAAPQYLSYGCVSLLHARYAYKGRDLESVTLDIYDMGSQLGAYGIYSSGRPRKISRHGWGVEGYRSATVAAAWKGRLYVRASADDDIPVLIGKLEALMDQVTAAIPGESSWPPELSILPENRLISGSDRYVRQNLLGHSFLPGGFLANYGCNGSEGLLFVSDLKSLEMARRSFDLFYSFQNDRSKILKKGKIGDASFWAQDPEQGFGIVMRRQSYVAGLWGIDDAGIAEEIAAELDGNLLSFVSVE